MITLHFKKKILYDFISVEKEFSIDANQEIIEICQALTPTLNKIIMHLTNRFHMPKKHLLRNSNIINNYISIFERKIRKVNLYFHKKNKIIKNIKKNIIYHAHINFIELLIKSNKIDSSILKYFFMKINDCFQIIQILKKQSLSNKQIKLVRQLSKIIHLLKNNTLSVYQLRIIKKSFEIILVDIIRMEKHLSNYPQQLSNQSFCTILVNSILSNILSIFIKKLSQYQLQPTNKLFNILTSTLETQAVYYK